VNRFSFLFTVGVSLFFDNPDFWAEPDQSGTILSCFQGTIEGGERAFLKNSLTGPLNRGEQNMQLGEQYHFR
jgi:hypothetical protein